MSDPRIDSRYCGMGAAGKLAGRAPAHILRLALLGKLPYVHTQDGRIVFDRQDVLAIKSNGEPAKRRHRPQPAGA